jgi:hypothetical protein
MDLTIAGMIGGAGNAASQALNTAQTGFLASQLQAERDKLETARLQMHETYAGQREQRGYAHAEALQQGTQAFETGQQQERIGAELTKTGMEQALKREEDVTAKGLKEKEIAAQEKHYGAVEKHYSALEKYYTRAGLEPKDVPESVKETVKFLSDQNAVDQKTANDPMTPPEKAAQLEKRITARSRMALSLLGHNEESDTSPTSTIQSPYPLPGERKATGVIAAPPATPTETIPAAAPVEPTRPSIPRGRLAPQKLSQMKKQQLDYDVLAKTKELEQAKIHGNRARIQALQAELDALEAQQGAGSELAARQGSR